MALKDIVAKARQEMLEVAQEFKGQDASMRIMWIVDHAKSDIYKLRVSKQISRIDANEALDDITYNKQQICDIFGLAWF